MDDVIYRQAVVDAIEHHEKAVLGGHNYTEGIAYGYAAAHRHLVDIVKQLPSAQPDPEDYTEMKQEFLRMASYIDVLLECSDEQRESLMGFISRLAECMPWTERD